MIRTALPWTLAAAALGLAAWAWWPAPRGDVLGASLAAFSKQNRLTVFSAQLSPVVVASDGGPLGMLPAKQVAVIPARVDYAIDMSRMTRDRLAWDPAARRLDVRLPPISVGRPDLDEARGQYLREGVWIGRSVQDRMTRDNTRSAESKAAEEAARPLMTGMACSAAKEAVRQNLAIPLQVAGFGDVTVAVRCDGEGPPAAN
jgi:Protein of unknown function (DUF4230)